MSHGPPWESLLLRVRARAASSSWRGSNTCSTVMRALNRAKLKTYGGGFVRSYRRGTSNTPAALLWLLLLWLPTLPPPPPGGPHGACDSQPPASPAALGLAEEGVERDPPSPVNAPTVVKYRVCGFAFFVASRWFADRELPVLRSWEADGGTWCGSSSRTYRLWKAKSAAGGGGGAGATDFDEDDTFLRDDGSRRLPL